MATGRRIGPVVVVGSLNLDLVARVSRHPHPGETVVGASLRTFSGGKGANQAVAARRAGAVVHLIGRIGADVHGETLRAGLVAEGIEAGHVGVCRHEPTGLALIVVDDRGENTIVVASGANATLRPEHIDDAALDGLFDDASVLLTQLECPLATVQHALVTGRDAGLITVLNAAPAPEPGQLTGELLSLVDVLVVNEHEHAALGSAAGQVRRLVVTLGERGVRCGDLHLLGHRMDVIDTTGAGDAFCGAFAAALAEGRPLADSLARANAAGALAVTAPGAQASLPTTEQIDSMLP